jgi:hypothetical protein
MNDNPAVIGPQEYEQFVFRRLEEPFPFFGRQLPEWMWLVCLGVVLSAALVYVVFMYIKDARGVGAWWASLLGTLRLAVYAILALVFLLPARQSYVKTVSEGRAITIFDTSGSMHTSDVLPSGDPKQVRPSRQDQVLDFLLRKTGGEGDRQLNFFGQLEAKNPLAAYRFGSKLDEEYILLQAGRALTRTEKEKPEIIDGKTVVPDVGGLPDSYWTTWLKPESKVDLAGLTESEKLRLDKLANLNARLIGERFTAGTNLGEPILAVLGKEANNRLQGVVVFTDGRNTEGSTSALRELEQRARAAKVPIFVVGVGEDRQRVKIEIADLRLPALIQPEDKFPVKADLTGEGLGGQPLDVTLVLSHVRTYKQKQVTKDGKTIEVEKEELLPIELVERDNPESPKPAKDRPKFPLGSAPIEIKAPAAVVLDKSATPRAEVEWQFDAAALAAAAKKADLPTDKKWEIGETRDDSELRWVVKVPVDKREGLPVEKKFHQSPKASMKVEKKPLRILMVAAGANRDFQFVQVLLSREVDKKRMELAVHLQMAPGETTPRTGKVQNVPPDRLLLTFPDTFRQKKDLFDLQSYDVIILYDPDWKQITGEQIKNLKRWSDAGGGLIMIGGHLNTVELIRPRDGEDQEKYEPLLKMLPVELDDRRDYVERKADEPFALDVGDATPEFEFMKLDEEMDETKFKEDWQTFFFGEGKERTEKAQRGFYSFYPVQKAKTGCPILARYTDPATKLKDGTLHPVIVVQAETQPRVVWIGSAETWRLREYKEAYHERFWSKLVRYAGSKSTGTVQKQIQFALGASYPALKDVPIEAKILGPNGEPLPKEANVEIRIKVPTGVNEKEINGGKPIKMSPSGGSKAGWFTGRFVPRSPGEYEVTVRVAKMPGMDSDLVETLKTTVKEANPELDNTRPDFDLMYRLASEADDVFRRMKDADAALVRKSLVRPKLGTGGGLAPGGEGDKDGGKVSLDRPRLFFNLTNAHLIPLCMMPDRQTSVSKGPHKDLWDEGITLWTPSKAKETDPDPNPVKLSYVLLAVVGLLSLEWLTRKLLRLA